jgi:hypothetical protein
MGMGLLTGAVLSFLYFLGQLCDIMEKLGWGGGGGCP